MKTYRNLYPQRYDFANLYAAYRAARRAKRGRVEVARFTARVEDALFRLQAELRDECYQPGAYRHFFIRKRCPTCSMLNWCYPRLEQVQTVLYNYFVCTGQSLT